jgi:dolichyl-phosphate-mannose--protein O-mannosyl transferase
METALSRGKKLLFPVAKPERVAQVLIKNRNKDTGLAYVPVFWLPLSWVLQYLPWFIFKKLKF